MPYRRHFVHADDLINSLSSIVPAISNPMIQVKYVAFITIAGVTVYELAIKEIFISFANKKGKSFGEFTRRYFKRINGRIKLEDLKSDYIPRFGDRYLNRFNRKVASVKKAYLITHHRDILNSYRNLITWRNEFAHEGKSPSYATFSEVVNAYQDGKEVIRVLSETMVR